MHDDNSQKVASSNQDVLLKWAWGLEREHQCFLFVSVFLFVSWATSGLALICVCHLHAWEWQVGPCPGWEALVHSACCMHFLIYRWSKVAQHFTNFWPTVAQSSTKSCFGEFDATIQVLWRCTKSCRSTIGQQLVTSCAKQTFFVDHGMGSPLQDVERMATTCATCFWMILSGWQFSLPGGRRLRVDQGYGGAWACVLYKLLTPGLATGQEKVAEPKHCFHGVTTAGHGVWLGLASG